MDATNTMQPSTSRQQRKTVTKTRPAADKTPPATAMPAPPASPAPSPTGNLQGITNTRPYDARTRPKTRRAFMLLGASLLIPLLFDRLVITTMIEPPLWASIFGFQAPLAVFWLLCAAIVTALHPRETLSRPLIWLVDAAMAALALWTMEANTRFHGNTEFEAITILVAMPSLLMLHAQLASGLYDVHRPLGIVVNWFAGWVVKPFSRLGDFGRAVAAVGRTLRGVTAGTGTDGAGPDDATTGARDARGMLRKAGVALLIAVPLLIALLTLLSGADMVFRYTLTHIIGDIDPGSLCMHAAWTLLPMPFTYSLLANMDDDSPAARRLYGTHADLRFDGVVTTLVLGMVLAVYAVFCAVQFTFLFAGAGLPDGLTYAEYARSGFFQLLTVAAINLIIFALTLAYARRTRALAAMLIGLIAATGVMLVSAARRLMLYIDAYGLTWLRYAAATVIALLAVMLLLALIRMVAAKPPLAATCFAAFLIWYVAFGWSDPAYVINTFDVWHGIGGAGITMM